MEIGVALPQMAADYQATSTLDWARRIDAGPFSSVSAGERVTFSNPEMVTALAASAAVSQRVRIFANLWVLPQHPMAMVAPQIGTLDQISAGRLEIAVGVGGREDDYRALGARFAGRHQALDDKVQELKALLAGRPPFEGAAAVGPSCVQPDGPRILAGAMGPKAMARAAVWADGISGFSIAGDAAEIAAASALADRCWEAAGRATTPRKVSGCFVALGVADPAQTLFSFTSR
ncbi:MAG: LLM class flavin-dependent oxidoreductase [Marmoricola sp.]